MLELLHNPSTPQPLARALTLCVCVHGTLMNTVE